MVANCEDYRGPLVQKCSLGDWAVVAAAERPPHSPRLGGGSSLPQMGEVYGVSSMNAGGCEGVVAVAIRVDARTSSLICKWGQSRDGVLQWDNDARTSKPVSRMV